jgi:hypothetical protein
MCFEMKNTLKSNCYHAPQTHSFHFIFNTKFIYSNIGNFYSIIPNPFYFISSSFCATQLLPLYNIL